VAQPGASMVSLSPDALATLPLFATPALSGG
jgi:hypothetical protein